MLKEFGIAIEENPIVIENASVIPPPVVRTLDSRGAVRKNLFLTVFKNKADS